MVNVSPVVEAATNGGRGKRWLLTLQDHFGLGPTEEATVELRVWWRAGKKVP